MLIKFERAMLATEVDVGKVARKEMDINFLGVVHVAKIAIKNQRILAVSAVAGQRDLIAVLLDDQTVILIHDKTLDDVVDDINLQVREGLVPPPPEDKEDKEDKKDKKHDE